MSNNKPKGTAKLSDEAEQNRLQVVEVELRARFWKAQYEVRYYTIEAEKIQPEYDEWLKAQQIKNEKMQKDFEEQLKKLQENGAAIQVDGQPIEYSGFSEIGEFNNQGISGFSGYSGSGYSESEGDLQEEYEKSIAEMNKIEDNGS